MVPSSSNRPACSAASRTWPIRASVRPAGKKGRPVLVQTAPHVPVPGTPNRAWTAAGERQTRSTAREPMCFSSHSTEATPSDR